MVLQSSTPLLAPAGSLMQHALVGWWPHTQCNAMQCYAMHYNTHLWVGGHVCNAVVQLLEQPQELVVVQGHLDTLELQVGVAKHVCVCV